MERERALANGPPCIEADITYAGLLKKTGWHVAECIDISGYFVRSQSRLIRAQEKHEAELRQLLGDAETEARMTSMKDRLAVREASLHRRELHVATPAT